MFYQGMLGDRWRMVVRTREMKAEPDCRRAGALLDRARRLGGYIKIPQLDLNISAPGLPEIATTTSAGRSVPITGLTPGCPLREGQWLSVIAGGRRYADKVAAQVIADASGQADVEIENLIRKTMTAGDTVEVAAPMIEGAVEITYRPPQVIERTGYFEFIITERR